MTKLANGGCAAMRKTSGEHSEVPTERAGAKWSCETRGGIFPADGSYAHHQQVGRDGDCSSVKKLTQQLVIMCWTRAATNQARTIGYDGQYESLLAAAQVTT